MRISKYLTRKLKGSLRCAKEQGMVVGKNVSVMGGVDFGSEPYLITLHDNCRISCNVAFINHDGERGLFVMITSAIKMLLNMELLKLGSLPL